MTPAVLDLLVDCSIVVMMVDDDKKLDKDYCNVGQPAMTRTPC